MKNIFFKKQTLIIGSLALGITVVASSFVKRAVPTPPVDDLEGTISISGAFALYPITVKWADEFKKLHPNVKFNISAGGAGKGITDALSGLVDIGLASRDIDPAEVKKGAYTIYVTKDAVVPTFNTGNPNAAALLAKGVKRDQFLNVFVTGNIKNWNQLAGKVSVPIHVYNRSDAAGAGETWAKYFGKKQEDLLGVGVYGDPGLAQAVKKDVTGIGYNNLAYLYDLKTRKQVAGVHALPIDVNGNGKIDADENFYETIDQLTDAIAAGKYPSPPARNLGFLFKGKPKKKELIEFVKFVLTTGQKDVDENGYIALSKAKIQEELKKVN
ncbi:PstS family phosphate ABC transporter substrate-binding protein [Mucilaginibacter sp. BJC16-A38]|uniref:PstS family phosphate ABC transporter substrate-binding protein n=1 Tax=Mucilaginibacter phenanthrenivorans TaxID=1234842 RepID=UPI0021582EEA|nr:PstS family phosphate ABC transporter substrate-binding protein [Mucilaginibacter phenanthrenivorans]MCR8560566.1 PstS family phosphate ABC transporter substrate-binding protein [Mucilaginibacter phenanthrenivorans]